MTFYKIFHLNPGVKLTLNLIYGGGMKDVKIEMSEAETEKKRERGERTEQYYMYCNLCIYFWNKKENSIYCFDGFFSEGAPLFLRCKTN